MRLPLNYYFCIITFVLPLYYLCITSFFFVRKYYFQNSYSQFKKYFFFKWKTEGDTGIIIIVNNLFEFFLEM